MDLEKRYKRHLMIKEIGLEGQKKIKESRVLVIGAGGLGSPVILYLSAAGVGKLGIADFDVVDESNLQRQVLYTTMDIGKSKAELAAKRVRNVNPECEVAVYNYKIAKEDLEKLVKEYDIIVDAVDNGQTKYIINEVAVQYGKPAVFGGIKNFSGYVKPYIPGKTSCYECIYPNDNILYEPVGVLGSVVGTIGAIEATQVLKIILGIEPKDRLMYMDSLYDSWQNLNVKPNCKCPICGKAEV